VKFKEEIRILLVGEVEMVDEVGKQQQLEEAERHKVMWSCMIEGMGIGIGNTNSAQGYLLGPVPELLCTNGCCLLSRLTFSCQQIDAHTTPPTNLLICVTWVVNESDYTKKIYRFSSLEKISVE
jgi:hypothetical protein